MKRRNNRFLHLRLFLYPSHTATETRQVDALVLTNEEQMELSRVL